MRSNGIAQPVFTKYLPNILGFIELVGGGSGWYTGADPGFLDRGGAKDFVHATHIPSVKHKVPYNHDNRSLESL